VGVPVGWEAGVEEDGGGEGEQSGWCSVSLYRALVRACALLLGQITFIPIQASRAKVSLFSAQKPGMWMGLVHLRSPRISFSRDFLFFIFIFTRFFKKYTGDSEICKSRLDTI
jgi:hypothetical protein